MGVYDFLEEETENEEVDKISLTSMWIITIIGWFVTYLIWEDAGWLP